MSLSFGALFWWSIRHEHLKIALTPGGSRRAMLRFSVRNLAYIVAIGIAFVIPPASLLISGLVAACYIFEQTPRQQQRLASGGPTTS